VCVCVHRLDVVCFVCVYYEVMFVCMVVCDCFIASVHVAGRFICVWLRVCVCVCVCRLEMLCVTVVCVGLVLFHVGVCPRMWNRSCA